LADDFLPIAKPDLSDADIAEVVDTLSSGWLVYGPKTQRFEQQLREYTGAEHALAVSSCTAGMHVALLACGVGPGDEVITSPLTFPATANVIVHCGATPVLADISRDDLQIDPKQVERMITPRTKAIMPVHYAGQACDMDAINDIARAHGLRVIEDAATAAGTRYKGRPVGALGDATSFSFYAIKNMTTGQGGMVTTNDDEIADAVSALRNHGLDNTAWNRYSAEASRAFYTITSPGFNYGMTDVQASIGMGQLARLDQYNQRRGELAARYSQALAEVPEVETPVIRPDVTTNWHLYVVRLHLDRLKIDRDTFITELKKHGVGTSVHYFPVHYHPYYRENYGFKPEDYPVVGAEFGRLISLPLFPLMQDADVDRVVEAIEAIVAEHRR
jgi:dTDP-4-amino-4,6-dideoxygalactose transaminase